MQLTSVFANSSMHEVWWCPLGALGGAFRRLWGSWGPLWGLLGASWGPLGSSLEGFGRVLGGSGGNFGVEHRYATVMDGFRFPAGPSWRRLGVDVLLWGGPFGLNFDAF